MPRSASSPFDDRSGRPEMKLIKDDNHGDCRGSDLRVLGDSLKIFSRLRPCDEKWKEEREASSL
jgi:hypothetical protein